MIKQGEDRFIIYGKKDGETVIRKMKMEEWVAVRYLSQFF